MSWVSLVRTVLSAFAAIVRLYERRKIEQAARNERELEIRDEQDRIRDDVRNADPNRVSDEELIERR